MARKLYLCSYRIPTPDALFTLIDKDAAAVTVAYIPNAKDYYAPRARQFKLHETTQYLEAFGMNVTVVDLREYNDAQQLKAILANFDLLWVGGGNTFCLRYEMQRIGFDQVIGDVLESVVYAGESAGACVAGTSLKGIEVEDEPEFAEQILWNGLSLVPNVVLPHANNDAIAESMRQLYKDDASLLEITDWQAYVIHDEEHTMTQGSPL